MRLRSASLAASLLCGSVVWAGAQTPPTATVQLTATNAPGGSPVLSPDGTYYESPYSGTVNGVLQRLNCVDFFHDVVVGEVWTANTINLGDALTHPSLLSFTRDASVSNALQLYEQGAWLTDQIAPNPQSNSKQTIAIQTAIWAVVDVTTGNNFLSYTPSQWVGSLVTDNTNQDVNSTGYWIGQASNHYALEPTSYYNKFNILSDVNINNSNCLNNAATSYTCTAQEYIYATPEPGSLALFGTGFVALVGGTVRRRRRSAGPDSESVAEVAEA